MEQTGKWSPINDLENKITFISSGGWMGTTNLAVNSGGGAQSNDLYVSPNSDYLLTGFFKTPSHTATLGKAQLIYFDAAGTLIQTDETNAFGWSDTWSPFILNSHSPANAVKMQIRLINGGDSGPVLFDEIRLKLPNLQSQDSYQFTGKKEDDGTGLKYFGARFYDPETGRFMTEDPMKSGENWYEYCNDNPVNLIDPVGFRYLDPHDNPDYNDDISIDQRSHDHDFIDKSNNNSSIIGWDLNEMGEEFSYRLGPYKITINLGSSLSINGDLTINLDANGNVSSVTDANGIKVNIVEKSIVGFTIDLIDFSLGKNTQITGSIKGCLGVDFEGDIDLWKADLSNKYGQSIEVTVALCRDLGIQAPALNPAKGYGPLFCPGPWGGWEYQF
jgi:RHS repeat-associated protein